jgi:hypothetical protein
MKNLYLLFLYIILFSCQKKHFEDADIFTFADFGKEEILLKAEFLALDDSILIMPSKLILKDSFLILNNSSNDFYFQIFNLNNLMETNECIGIGQGPDELLSPDIIQSNDSNIWILDIYKKEIDEYSFTDFLSESRPKYLQKIKIEEEHYTNAIVFPSLKILTVFSSDPKQRFGFYDDDGKLLAKKGSYPEIDIFDTEFEKARGYDFDCTTNFQNRIFVSHKLTDLIEIYDIDGNLLRRLHGPEQFFPAVEEVRRTEGKYTVSTVRAIPGKAREAYFCPINAGKEVFVLYSGKIEDNNAYLMNIIFVFDWEGNPIRKYKLDTPIFQFCVDVNNRTIYGITNYPEYRILKFRY